MVGTNGEYPYSLRKDWLCREELNESELEAVSTALAARTYEDRYASALQINPNKRGTTGPQNADLTYFQLKCLEPSTFLNDQVINVTLTMLQRLPEAATVLVLPTSPWVRYQGDTRGCEDDSNQRREAFLKLQRIIRKHLEEYNVRSAVVPCSLPLYVLHI
jgi:hypothetical protein